MTNKEIINSMSDTELAKYLYDRGNCREYCYGICAYQDKCDGLVPTHVCLDGVLKWLNSEAKDGLST